MRHRETYYKHLHAKITKYVDLLLHIYSNVFWFIFIDRIECQNVYGVFDKVRGIIFSATECTSNVWHAVSVLHWTFGVLHLFAMTTRYDTTVAQLLGTAPN